MNSYIIPRMITTNRNKQINNKNKNTLRKQYRMVVFKETKASLCQVPEDNLL